MVGESPGSDYRRPEGVFADTGCKPVEFGGKIADRAVIEELLCSFGSPETEDFGIRKALGHNRISACGDSFENADAEEFVCSHCA